ncbi:MAG: type II toxin-antitoxin system death-on-curing family toxin [Chloroflexota bacterium]
MRYLSLSELIYINGTMLNNKKILSGTQEIRDIALLEAAVARPAASAFGQDAYLTLSEKAAALLHSLVRNHPFTDGNKRTATVATIFMFAVNGQRIIWQPEEALTFILKAAEGQYDLDSLARWFPLTPSEESPQEDAEKDMLTIARIIEDQRWLLDELSKR